MKLLAFDTSSTACSVALLMDDKIYMEHEIAPMRQTQLILPMITQLLDLNKIALNQLDAIAFGCGPGSFTGIRIAVSVAQGLGFATTLPLISVSSLAALAQAAYEDLKWKKLCVAVDARIQEIYWGAYEVNSDGLVKLVGKEVICAPAHLPQDSFDGWYGVGNAWEIYAKEIACAPLQVDVTRLPMASAIARLAKEKGMNKEWVQAGAALPVYLRDEVAKRSC